MRWSALKKGVLKWSLVGLALFILSIAVPASAQEGEFSAEFMGAIGLGPDDPDFQLRSTFAPGVGIGYNVDEYIQLRADVSYFKWKDAATVCRSGCSTFSLHLQDIPIFLGGRFFLPLDPFVAGVRLFGELGLSANLMKAEFSNDSGGGLSDSKLKIGIVPGIGVDFRVAPSVSIGLNGRYHVLSKGVGELKEGGTSFFSVAVLAAYDF